MISGAKGLAHLALYVKDYKATMDFYCNKIGFKSIWDRTTEDPVTGKCESSFLQLGNLVLEILAIEKVHYPQDGTFQHLAIEVDDLDKAYAEAKEMGLNPSEIGVDDGVLTGSKWFMVQGPDGESVEFSYVKK